MAKNEVHGGDLEIYSAPLGDFWGGKKRSKGPGGPTCRGTHGPKRVRRGCKEGAQRVQRGCGEGAKRVQRGCKEGAERVQRW